MKAEHELVEAMVWYTFKEMARHVDGDGVVAGEGAGRHGVGGSSRTRRYRTPRVLDAAFVRRFPIDVAH